MANRRLTRAEKQAITRARVLDAAAKLFARRGFDGVSLDEVAAAAGFSKGAVYSNFESKAELLLTLLVERHSRRIMDGLPTLFGGEGPPEERAREGGVRLASIIERDREGVLLFVELWVAAARSPRLRRKFAALYEQWQGLIIDLLRAQGDELENLLPLPVPQVAAAAHALVEGFALQKVIDPKRLPKGFLGDVLAAFFGGLRALARESGARAAAEAHERAARVASRGTGTP